MTFVYSFALTGTTRLTNASDYWANGLMDYKPSP